MNERNMPFSVALSAIALGAGASLAACAAATVGGPLRVESNNVTGAATGPAGDDPDPVPTTLLRNRGGTRVVVRRVRSLWDTADGRRGGSLVGAFVIGSDADLRWGEGGPWPPPQFPRRKRRWVPGGFLKRHEQGQIWAGVVPPKHGTSHLVGFRVSYRVGTRAFTVRAPVDYWYCYDQTMRECDAQIDAASRR